MMRRWGVSPILAFFLVLAVACGDDAPAPTATPSLINTAIPEPTATPPPTATPRPRPEANAFPPDLEEEARRLIEQIVAVRGTPLKRDVEMFLMTRDQARKFYSRDEGDQEKPEEQPPAPSTPLRIDTKQAVYELLGLVPPREQRGGRTVEQDALDNLIAVLTGFYSPPFNAFYLIETINGGIFGALARSTIVHEVTHAIQYQYADVDRLSSQRARNFDATTALLSVLEGDAVYTETRVLGYSTRSAGYRQPLCFQIPPRQRTGTPFVVERELDVWYEEGFCFIQALVQQDPQALGRIWENPPSTMEQVLHPEKYLAGEAARSATRRTLTPALGDGWPQLGEGVLGEFGLQNILLLGLMNDRPAVQAVAAGWGGDAWALYAAGDSRLLHMESVWDSPEEAREFWGGLNRSLNNRAEGQPASAGEAGYSITLGGSTWRTALQDDRVTVLVSNLAAAVDTASRELGLP
jgi:hypothetical protein